MDSVIQILLLSSDLLLHMLISVSTGSFDISSDEGTATARLSVKRDGDLNSSRISTTTKSVGSTELNETTLSTGKVDGDAQQQELDITAILICGIVVVGLIIISMIVGCVVYRVKTRESGNMKQLDLYQPSSPALSGSTDIRSVAEQEAPLTGSHREFASENVYEEMEPPDLPAQNSAPNPPDVHNIRISQIRLHFEVVQALSEGHPQSVVVQIPDNMDRSVRATPTSKPPSVTSTHDGAVEQGGPENSDERNMPKKDGGCDKIVKDVESSSPIMIPMQALPSTSHQGSSGHSLYIFSLPDNLPLPSNTAVAVTPSSDSQLLTQPYPLTCSPPTGGALPLLSENADDEITTYADLHQMLSAKSIQYLTANNNTRTSNGSDLYTDPVYGDLTASYTC